MAGSTFWNRHKINIAIPENECIDDNICHNSSFDDVSKLHQCINTDMMRTFYFRNIVHCYKCNKFTYIRGMSQNGYSELRWYPGYMCDCSEYSKKICNIITKDILELPQELQHADYMHKQNIIELKKCYKMISLIKEQYKNNKLTYFSIDDIDEYNYDIICIENKAKRNLPKIESAIYENNEHSCNFYKLDPHIYDKYFLYS
jgi:hypothetical protein